MQNYMFALFLTSIFFHLLNIINPNLISEKGRSYNFKILGLITLVSFLLTGSVNNEGSFFTAILGFLTLPIFILIRNREIKSGKESFLEVFNSSSWREFIPGFRSGRKRNKIIASIYYVISILLVFTDLSLALFYLSLPFIVFYIRDLIKNKGKSGVGKANSYIFLLALFIGLGSLSVLSSEDISREYIDTSQSEQVKELEPEGVDEEEGLVEEAGRADSSVLAESDLPVEDSLEKDYDRELRIHFIDVGQGDSIFIELPNNENLLIDAGPAVNRDHLLEYLKEIGFQKLDYVLATHPHEDHIGGMAAVMNNWEIGRLYMPDKIHTTKAFENFINSGKKNAESIIKASTGTVILDDADLSIRILAPDINTSGDNLNDYSLVVRLDYIDNSFLFTGDAEVLTEQYILADNSEDELKVDLLKVGHHGSNSSTSQPFIESLDPDYAVITCGQGNNYGHPAPEVLDRLEAVGSKIYRTDRDGSILVDSDGKKIDIRVKGNPLPAVSNPDKSNSSTSSSGSGDFKKDASSKSSTPSKKEAPKIVETETDSSFKYLGNKNSKKFHYTGCSSAKRTKESNRVYLNSREEAISKGYSPCGNCKP